MDRNVYQLEVHLDRIKVKSGDVNPSYKQADLRNPASKTLRGMCFHSMQVHSSLLKPPMSSDSTAHSSLEHQPTPIAEVVVSKRPAWVSEIFQEDEARTHIAQWAATRTSVHATAITAAAAAASRATKIKKLVPLGFRKVAEHKMGRLELKVAVFKDAASGCHFVSGNRFLNARFSLDDLLIAAGQKLDTLPAQKKLLGAELCNASSNASNNASNSRLSQHIVSISIPGSRRKVETVSLRVALRYIDCLVDTCATREEGDHPTAVYDELYDLGSKVGNITSTFIECLARLYSNCWAADLVS